jgi:prevent-host-death family protein
MSTFPSIPLQTDNIPQIVSASEAKNKFGSIMTKVDEDKKDIIVESRGEPKVVIVSYKEYEKLSGLKEQERRRELLIKLEALRERIQVKNKDLTPDRGDALADKFVREVINEMAQEKKIKFGDK